MYALSAALALNALLGPLVLSIIDYRYGPSMLSQGIGPDAVTLLLVAQIAAWSGALIRHDHRAGSVLAMGPAAFTAYMMPQ